MPGSGHTYKPSLIQLFVCASPARCGCWDAKRFGFSQDCCAVRCESLWAGRNLPFFSGTQRKTVKSALNCSGGQTEEQRRQTQPDLTQLTGGFSELFAVENDITVPNSQHKDSEKNAHNIPTWMYTLNLDQASIIPWFPLVLILLQISFKVILHILMISLKNSSEEPLSVAMQQHLQ